MVAIYSGWSIVKRCLSTVNTIHWSSFVPMLGHRLRCWPRIKAAMEIVNVANVQFSLISSLLSDFFTFLPPPPRSLDSYAAIFGALNLSYTLLFLSFQVLICI